MNHQSQVRQALMHLCCGHFTCSEQELIDAMRATDSTEVGVVGLSLATRYALESFDVSVSE